MFILTDIFLFMQGEKQKVKSSPVLTSKPSTITNNIILVIASLYFLVDCVPKVEIIDQMGIHWLLIGLLNLVAGLFILRNNTFLTGIRPIFKNNITWLYLAFVTISGISICFALNKGESLIIYSRLLTVCITVFIFSILFYNRKELLKDLIVVITLIVLAQSFSGVMQFYADLGKIELSTLVNSLQSTTGNKNIFAAALVIKIPLIIYCILKRQGFLKYLGLLALFLAILTVFFINARSAYLGLLLSFLTIGGLIIYLQLKSKSIAQFKLNSLLILGTYVLAFFISQNTLTKAKQLNQTTVYGTFADRLGTVVDTDNEATNIRLKYWKGALDLISKKPLTGVGYGNWKLYSPLYTGPLIDDNLFSKHPHNDFIEIAGESGILNSIIFLSIFICALLATIRMLRSKQDPELKLISIIILASLGGYFIDAFFNFPSERPNIQVLFAFILGVILTNYLAPSEANSESHKPVSKLFVIMPAILIGIATIYMHAVVFQSLKAQWLVDNDLNSIDNIPGALPKLNYAQVSTILPEYPQIAENSEIMAFKKAKYLRAEKRYKAAIHLLDSVQYQSPYLPYSDYLKCNIYLETKQLDSAYKYGKRAAAIKPRNFYYFRMASYLARVNNDIDGVHKLFKAYHTYRNDQQSWSYYALTMFYSKANRAEVKKVVDSGLKYYPQDTIMLSYKPFLPK